MGGSTRAPPRRDEALAFIINRLVRTGSCPLLDEIGGALRVSPGRARQFVDQLVARGYIERVPGAPRGLKVRDVSACRALIVEEMRRLGWVIADPLGPLRLPFTGQ